MISLLRLLVIATPLIGMPWQLQSANAASRVQNVSQWYIGTNPVSTAMLMPVRRDIKYYLPAITGSDYGIPLVVGWQRTMQHALETSISYGQLRADIIQVQVATRHFGLYNTSWSLPYVSGAVRYRYLKSDGRNIRAHTVVPKVALGIRWIRRNLFTDIEISQSLVRGMWASNKDSFSLEWHLSDNRDMARVIPSLRCVLGVIF